MRIVAIGLIFGNGSSLREEPCTDPYAWFCGRTGARHSLLPDESELAKNWLKYSLQYTVFLIEFPQCNIEGSIVSSNEDNKKI